MARVFRFACERAFSVCVSLYGFMCDGNKPRDRCRALIVFSKYGLCGRVYVPRERCGRRTRHLSEYGFCAGCEVFSSSIRGQGASAGGYGGSEKRFEKSGGKYLTRKGKKR